VLFLWKPFLRRGQKHINIKQTQEGIKPRPTSEVGILNNCVRDPVLRPVGPNALSFYPSPPRTYSSPFVSKNTRPSSSMSLPHAHLLCIVPAVANGLPDIVDIDLPLLFLPMIVLNLPAARRTCLNRSKGRLTCLVQKGLMILTSRKTALDYTVYMIIDQEPYKSKLASCCDSGSPWLSKFMFTRRWIRMHYS
jgi:hypothetical protein